MCVPGHPRDASLRTSGNRQENRATGMTAVSCLCSISHCTVSQMVLLLMPGLERSGVVSGILLQRILPAVLCVVLTWGIIRQFRGTPQPVALSIVCFALILQMLAAFCPPANCPQFALANELNEGQVSLRAESSDGRTSLIETSTAVIDASATVSFEYCSVALPGSGGSNRIDDSPLEHSERAGRLGQAGSVGRPMRHAPALVSPLLLIIAQLVAIRQRVRDEHRFPSAAGAAILIECPVKDESSDHQ